MYTQITGAASSSNARKVRTYGYPVSGVVACLVTRCGGMMGLTCLRSGITAGHASVVTTPEVVRPLSRR
jgi:hypothetical protein